ncbi:nickel pincer cofactor biosynthesis protein LarC [Mycobacterium sp. E796]|uniref:nickel pincer cofactor biosynthesis protein LarC n=1 Tax=Mycobacterium sp. E796 TaxID=1834151 RepID=UPI0008006FDD|nr:nickel pincer cofactor biosynthesis protein LarC [Mycobacterium sp. E796]OBI51998.1 TIGR00299 family protein [Mycobacterium sp. E796]
MSRVGWLDLRSGVAGDMIIGALFGAGVPLEVMAASVAELGLPITLREETVTRGGLAATKVLVDTPAGEQPSRRWRDVRAILQVLKPPLRDWALKIFLALAEAEAHVHGIHPDDVHFHEVGALDAIADVVASCAGFLHLDCDRIVVTPIALGGGSVAAAHGQLPVPGPAVLALMQRAGAPGFGGPDQMELATPTGVAIATSVAHEYGDMPVMRIGALGVGAGDADPAHRANVVRLAVGETDASTGAATDDRAVVLEANVDDMDPRLWATVLARLLDAGAGDAWLQPIMMKKGRPAHTLCVITSQSNAEAVREVIFRESTTIGLRQSFVEKFSLRRDFVTMEVAGEPIAIKRSLSPEGSVLNASAEWDDVARAAAALGLPAKHVLALANGLAAQHLPESSGLDT